jgi:hypothetical protein
MYSGHCSLADPFFQARHFRGGDIGHEGPGPVPTGPPSGKISTFLRSTLGLGFVKALLFSGHGFQLV